VAQGPGFVNSRPKCTTHVRLDVYQLASVAAV